MSPLILQYKRYRFWKVFVVMLMVSFAAFLFAYASKFVVGEPFHWAAYYEYLVNQILGTIASALLYYYALNTYHLLFVHKKPFSHFVAPSLLLISAVIIYNLLIDYLHPLQGNINEPIPLINQIVGDFLVALTYLGTSLGIAYINNLRDERKKHRALKEQALRLEVEKMQADLKFLKSQINPHFLHNTLNSFYSRSLPLSKELANGILTLSEIMRYSLEEANTPDGKVLLKDEVKHLRNLIKINQFRFRNSLKIDLEVKGMLNGAAIIPFVLVTLVENIFKHGDLSDTEQPIKILVELENDKLHYCSKNKKKIGPRELSTGIGLDNIKKHLDFAYGNDYTLEIKEDAVWYWVDLKIYKL